MKRLLILLPFLSGCSSMISTTERIPVVSQTYQGTNGPTVAYKESTHIRIRTLFDANAQVAKMSNRSGYTTGKDWGPGTYAVGVSENSNATNLVNIIGAVAQGVASGLK